MCDKADKVRKESRFKHGENVCDKILVAEGKEFHVHKSFLSERCKYFDTLFNGHFKEGSDTKIELDDTAADCLELVLNHFYHSEIDLKNLSEETVVKSLELARRYLIVPLEKEIFTYLVEMTSVDNIWLIFDPANKFVMPALVEECLDYADCNAKEILKHPSFLTLSEKTLIEMLARDTFVCEEMDIFRAVQSWIERNKPENVENVLRLIRLPLIDLHDLTKDVMASTLFSDSVILAAIASQVHGKYQDRNYRRRLMVEKNVALPGLRARVILGRDPECLLDGNSAKETYNWTDGFTWHTIGDVPRGMIIDLDDRYLINYIKMLILDVDENSETSYYINVSTDRKDWFRIVDNRECLCESWQELRFPPTVARFIRIVGTFNSTDYTFGLVHFECSFKN